MSRVQTQSNLNENPGGGVSQSDNKDFSTKKLKIKDIKAGQYVLSLDESIKHEKEGKLISLEELENARNKTG